MLRFLWIPWKRRRKQSWMEQHGQPFDLKAAENSQLGNWYRPFPIAQALNHIINLAKAIRNQFQNFSLNKHCCGLVWKAANPDYHPNSKGNLGRLTEVPPDTFAELSSESKFSDTQDILVDRFHRDDAASFQFSLLHERNLNCWSTEDARRLPWWSQSQSILIYSQKFPTEFSMVWDIVLPLLQTIA